MTVSVTEEAASFEGASLAGASLEGASLEGASLGGASLEGASASLEGASLEDASLEEDALEEGVPGGVVSGVVRKVSPAAEAVGERVGVVLFVGEVAVGCVELSDLNVVCKKMVSGRSSGLAANRLR